MAVVGAYEVAPEGSGVSQSLEAAEQAFIAMLDGERDPAEAVRKIVRNPRDERHWLFRWQSDERPGKVLADER